MDPQREGRAKRRRSARSRAREPGQQNVPTRKIPDGMILVYSIGDEMYRKVKVHAPCMLLEFFQRRDCAVSVGMHQVRAVASCWEAEVRGQTHFWLKTNDIKIF